LIKKILSWAKEAVKETLNLAWTLVGLIIATLTLTGSAQQITALATIITLAVWLLTIGFRK
jgi:homoserine trans-succinylase|tara:strand:+ start:820 stop:1002 length:183 start_codon:yes stop_codon:yes gene_type:complete